LAEWVHNSRFFDTAEGVNLDRTAVNNIGIVRRPAEKSIGTATFEGDEGSVIPEGFIITTGDDIPFETTEESEIDGTGESEVPIQAIEPGTVGNVPAGTITEIINPIVGIDSVINQEGTTGGRDEETDEEFRARYILSVSRGGAST